MEREEGGGGGRGERQGSRLRQRRGGREKRRANVQITPLASLARAAFYRDFLL